MDKDLREAMLQLLKVFGRRKDLHQAFPEVLSQDYRRLLEWAIGVVQKRWEDCDYDKLKPFSDRFQSLLSMTETHDLNLEKWRNVQILTVSIKSTLSKARARFEEALETKSLLQAYNKLSSGNRCFQLCLNCNTVRDLSFLRDERAKRPQFELAS